MRFFLCPPSSIIGIHAWLNACCKRLPALFVLLLALAPGTGFAQVPSAPSSLNVVGGAGQISLTWTGASGATSYKVYRGTAAGGEGTSPYASGVTAVSYKDTAVTAGTTYYYKVAAVNASGTSGFSNEDYDTPTSSGVPGVPGNLAATSGNASVSLTWGTVSGATGYHVKRSTSSSGPFTTVGSPTSASYNNTGLTNGTTYCGNGL